MQRHLRATYCQVSHLCRSTVPPIFMSPIGLQGISTSTIASGKLLLHEIFKPGPTSNGVGRTSSKFQSNKPNPEIASAARGTSSIDPLLPLFATKKTITADESSEMSQIIDETDALGTFEAESVQGRDLESVLGRVDLESLTIRHACQVIGRLGALNPKPDPAILEADERFVRVCNLIQRGNFSLSPVRLILTIQGLQKLGLSTNNNLIPELRNELKWVLRRCPVKLLAKAIKSLESNSKTSLPPGYAKAEIVGDSERSLTDTAVDLMNRRWVEAVTGSDFIVVFGIASLLSHETNEKLEDRAYELAQQFTTMEMVKMVTNLAQQKRRPVPLLKAIAFHLGKTNDLIPAKDIIELLYALGKINFTDQILVQKLCLELAPEVEKITNPAVISSLATALGRARYKAKELTEAMEEWVDKNFETMRPFDHAAWLLTSAVLNLQSERSQKFCTNVKLLLHKKNTPSPAEWLNIVHAFLILNQASVEQLTSVLTPQFVEAIDKLNDQLVGPRMKLLNINESLRVLVEPSKGKHKDVALLDPKFVSKWSEMESTQDDSLSNLLLSTLEQFLPPAKYFLRDVQTKSGVFIDAVCAVNSKKEPVPINPQNPQTKSKDLHKIALVVAGYTSLCVGSNSPTGQIHLHERLLQAEGYKVILVPFHEFNSRSNLLQRIKYLEAKIKDVSVPSETIAKAKTKSSGTR